MIDPSREVGKVEKSRSAVKKLIMNLRLKGSRHWNIMLYSNHSNCKLKGLL